MIKNYETLVLRSHFFIIFAPITIKIKTKMNRLIPLFAFVMLLVACGANEPSVGEKEAAIYREYAEKVKTAQSIEDIAQLQNEGGFEQRITELAPEWRALISGNDSSAYYAELAKSQPAKDSLKALTDAKLAEFIKNLKFE